MVLPVVVAIAAPVNPKAGIGPNPLIKIGHKMMLQILAIHKLFMAIAAFPAPRKIPLIKNNNTMELLPAIIICIKAVPCRAASSEAPINIRISVAYTNPKKLITAFTANEIITACIPAFAAFVGSFSPILRATTAVAAMLNPIASE
ncbi:hypothetical protein D3C80_1214460 [compost metagenome]